MFINTCCKSYNVKQHMLPSCLLIKLVLGPVGTNWGELGSLDPTRCEHVGDICPKPSEVCHLLLTAYLLWHGFKRGRSLCGWSSLYCQLQDPLEVLGVSPVMTIVCHDVHSWRGKTSKISNTRTTGFRTWRAVVLDRTWGYESQTQEGDFIQ